MPPPQYGQPIDADDEARKKAQNPLTQYFGGEKPPPRAPPPPPPAPAPPAPPVTNVGNGANPPQQRQQPTGFTNFGRVQSANRDVSTREAAKYGAQATQKANQAKSSLDALRARFGGEVAAGTVGGPGDTYSHSSDGTGPTADELLANGAKSYAGPRGLGDVDGVEDTYASILAAQQHLGALGNDEGIQSLVGGPASKFSSALIGSAGRKDFDALRARFSPEDDITKAETDAAAEATAAGDLSKKNAGAWTAAGEYQKRVDAEIAKNVKKQGEMETSEAAAKKLEQQWRDDFAATDKGNQRLQLKTTFEELDPLNYIGGGKRSAGMKWFGDLGHENYAGNISWLDSPYDKDVYSQMDAEQWEELAGLTSIGQRNWIDRRAAELQNGTGRPRGTYVSHK